MTIGHINWQSCADNCIKIYKPDLCDKIILSGLALKERKQQIKAEVKVEMSYWMSSEQGLLLCDCS